MAPHSKHPGPLHRHDQVRTCTALHAYKAMSPDEVSFSKGERMKIARDADDYGWLVVEKIDGTEGLAPLSHLNEDTAVGGSGYGQVRCLRS